MPSNTALAACLLMLVVAPVAAQDAPAPPTVPTDGIDVGADRITVGIGPALVPSYSGSDQYVVVPGIAVQGQVSGIAFNTQGTSLYVDVVPDHGQPGWKVQLGPLVALRLDRNSRISDPAVEALGKLKRAVEVGAWGGIQRTGVVTSPYDTLSIGASWQHDVSGAHGSYIVSPSVSYATPLSRVMYVSLSAGADYVGKSFGDYYYDVTLQGAAASGLRPFRGANKAGFKDWNTSILLAHSLTGNLTRGLGVFATGGYARILGAYGRSPLVRDVGDPDQWNAAVGLAYTF